MIKNLRRGLLATALAFAVLAPASPAQADEVTLMDGITALPVAEDVREGYKRELYPHWKDDDKNGCTARNDVLIAEAIEAPTVGADCALTGGVWHSSYDNVLVQGPPGVDIDHLIPLAEVHDSGGYGWTTERHRDTPTTSAPTPPSSASPPARTGRSPTRTRPPECPWAAVHCRYLGEWVGTKHRWGLAVDRAEREALLQ